MAVPGHFPDALDLYLLACGNRARFPVKTERLPTPPVLRDIPALSDTPHSPLRAATPSAVHEPTPQQNAARTVLIWKPVITESPQHEHDELSPPHEPIPIPKRKRDDDKAKRIRKRPRIAMACHGGCDKTFTCPKSREKHWKAYPDCEARHAKYINGTEEGRMYRLKQDRKDGWVHWAPE
ncbi:hypothetical protein AURDEDRAFT_158216 [Auricularia subglabra TFB-10046 SS5]|nr:hypothetical protein AURDEDRAFT_158216 [Auricularia subglabra TFB-10046 SS5]